jgi:hypothetical protein
MRRNSRNEHLDAITEEIRRVGGCIDRVELREHHFIYWSLGGRRMIQVLSPRGKYTISNARGDIRRQARMILDGPLLRCCAAI